jgi:hypothetical protein
MKYFWKFRTTNHHLPIEKGRHLGIERNLRTGTHCNKNIIGDEFHYLLECDTFKEIRTKMLRQYYYCHSNAYKLNELTLHYKYFNEIKSDIFRKTQDIHYTRVTTKLVRYMLVVFFCNEFDLNFFYFLSCPIAHAENVIVKFKWP